MFRPGRHPAAPSRRVRIAAWVTAICLLGDSALYVVLPVFYLQFGLSSLWEVGILLAVNRLVRIPIHPLIKRYYTRQTHEFHGLMIGVVLACASTLAYGIIDGFWLLLLARAIWGAAWSFLKQGGQLIVVQAVQDASMDNSGAFTGTYNSISRIGTLAGMSLGGIVSSAIGTDLLNIGFSCLAFVLIPVMYLKIKDSVLPTKRVPATIEREIKSNLLYPAKKPLLLMLVSAFFVAVIYQGLLKATLAYWVLQHDFSDVLLLGAMSAATWTGLLQTARWGFEVVFAPKIGKRADLSASKKKWIMAALMSSSLCFFILPGQLPTVIWLPVMALMILTAAIISTLMDAVMVESTAALPGIKHAIITHYLIVSDLGAAAGPIFGYVLIETAGLRMLGWTAAGVLVLAALLSGYSYRLELHSGAVKLKEIGLSDKVRSESGSC